MEKFCDFLNKNPQLVILLSGLFSIVTTIIVNWINTALAAKNDRLNYITRVQFDVELKIYQELSEKSFNAVESCSLLFPTEFTFEPREDNEKKKYEIQIYKTSVEKTALFQEAVYKNSPFIREEFATKFESLLREIIVQNNFYKAKLTIPNFKYNLEERGKVTRNIITYHKQVIDELRDYLYSLKIK